MLRSTVVWERLARRIRVLQTRPFCSKTSSGGDKVESCVSYYNETYKQLEKLDFATASKILFTDPPKKKKFGFDFHMVQLFFACLPSLAVYLVAQYARYEMRRMEGELELKKRQKEEKEKAKETEVIAAEEKDPELMEFKERLDKLEETIKEIVVESKKQSVEYSTKKPKEDQDPEILSSKNSERASESTKYNNSNRPGEAKESVMASGVDAGRSSGKTTAKPVSRSQEMRK